VRHAWIYGGMCKIRPPVYNIPFSKDILAGRINIVLNGGGVQMVRIQLVVF
jgi:hypothetical protein